MTGLARISGGRTVMRLSPEAAALAPPRPLIVFDHVCVLCCGFVQWVIAHDRRELFLFTPAQGSLGRALYEDLGLDPANFETNLLVVGDTAFASMDAFIEVAARLGGVYGAARLLRLIPRRLRDRLYRFIARNRFRLFGRRDTCWLPDPAISARVL
jgi:predicted DCC family thiol-disulfide oxidoreductase YuxK